MANYTLHEIMKARKQFCIRCDKQPFIRNTKRPNSFTSSWTNPQGWLTFAEALEALQKGTKVRHDDKLQAANGIGWLTARDDTDGPQVIGGDLDCCVDPETRYVSPWADTFLQTVQPFYTELSPSCCGIRFFVLGHLGRDSITGYGPQDDLPAESRERILVAKPSARKKLEKGKLAFNGLELYETNRHLSITGLKLNARCYPAEDRTTAISQVLAPFIVTETVGKAGKDVKKPSGKGSLPLLDILSVIDAMGFTEEGSQLFGPHPTLGSTGGRNLVVSPQKNVYCYMHDGINAGGDPWVWLACECGAVPWENAGSGVLKDRTVLRKTLEHAVKRGLVSAEEVGLQPVPINAEVPKPEKLNETFANDPIGALKDPAFLKALAMLKAGNPIEYDLLLETFKSNDLLKGVSKRSINKSVDKHAPKDQRRLAAANESMGLGNEDITKTHLTFNDVAKRTSAGNITVTEFLHSNAAHAIMQKLPVAYGADGQLYYWHGEIWQPNAEAVIHKELDAVVGNDVDTRHLREVIALVKSSLSFKPVAFNPNPELLGCKGGVLNCKTGEFRGYKAEDYITDQIPVSYDPAARCPEIIKFIEGLTPNYDDRITLLDIIASGAYRKALFYIGFLIGHGSSGSTKIIELIQAFYGEKTTEAVPLNELVEKQFALSALKDARFSFGQEVEAVKQTGTSRIKEISGGDWISADVKNKERARFRGSTKLVFKGNSIPRFTDTTYGFRRRYVEVTLPYKFVPCVDPNEPDQRQEDPEILAKIASLEELSGLLNLVALRLPWIIKNRQIYRRPGHYDAYKKQVDSVTTFLEEFCEYCPDAFSARVSIKKLHAHFEKWCGLIKGNLVEIRSFRSYVRRYCQDRPGFETTIDGKTETTYPGLTFDETKCKAEISRLQGLLKTGSDRIDTGSKSGQKIPNTGLIGLNSISNPIEDISAKDMWHSIYSLACRENGNIPFCSGDPVNDTQRHLEGAGHTGSILKQAPIDPRTNQVNPVPRPIDVAGKSEGRKEPGR